MTEREKRFLEDLILSMLDAVARAEQRLGGLSADGMDIDAVRGRAFEEVFARVDFNALVVEISTEGLEKCLDKDPERQETILSWMKVVYFFALFLASKGVALPESYGVGNADSEEEVLH